VYRAFLNDLPGGVGSGPWLDPPSLAGPPPLGGHPGGGVRGVQGVPKPKKKISSPALRFGKKYGDLKNLSDSLIVFTI
jgi:hypothetical protein